jgi:hypothetical protein
VINTAIKCGEKLDPVELIRGGELRNDRAVLRAACPAFTAKVRWQVTGYLVK